MRKSYKGLTGRWTKWGDGNYSILERQNMVPKNWVCQSCGKEQPMIIPPMHFEYPVSGEYIKICPPCFVDNCFELFRRAIDEV